jgi:spore maturation protein CgeB
MKFLIIGPMHHPEELAKYMVSLPADAPSPLFPPSQGHFFWVRALRKAGHDVQAFLRDAPILFGGGGKTARFGGFNPISTVAHGLANRAPRLHPDYAARNQRLLAQAKGYAPDVVLMVGGNRVIFPETLAALKKQGARIVYLSGVSPIVFSNAIEREAAPLYDLVIVNDYYHGIQWLELGAKRMEALPMSACDPDFHRPYVLSAEEEQSLACQIGFVGTLTPTNLYGDRVEAMQAVADLGLGIWSIHETPAALKPYWRGGALGQEMLKILCASKIQLNPHGNFMRYGGNFRLFEASGCGVFQISDDRPGVHHWFEVGKHLDVYTDPVDLRRKAVHYLAHQADRQAMAEAARAHVYAHHTYDHRMQALVGML